jgi:hypothetical protein
MGHRPRLVKKLSGWGGMLLAAAIIKQGLDWQIDGATKTAAAAFLTAWFIALFGFYISDYWDRHRIKGAVLFVIAGVGLFFLWQAYLPERETGPDVTLRFSSDEAIRFISAVAQNQSGTAAEGLRYRIDFINLTALQKQRPMEHVFSRYAPDPHEWIAPNQEQNLGPAYLRPEFMSSLREGDIMMGAAVMDCLKCRSKHGYRIYFQVGKGGWFAETADGSEPQIMPPLDITPEEKQRYFTDPETYLSTRPLFAKQPIKIER